MVPFLLRSSCAQRFAWISHVLTRSFTFLICSFSVCKGVFIQTYAHRINCIEYHQPFSSGIIFPYRGLSNFRVLSIVSTGGTSTKTAPPRNYIFDDRCSVTSRWSNRRIVDIPTLQETHDPETNGWELRYNVFQMGNRQHKYPKNTLLKIEKLLGFPCMLLIQKNVTGNPPPMDQLANPFSRRPWPSSNNWRSKSPRP